MVTVQAQVSYPRPSGHGSPQKGNRKTNHARGELCEFYGVWEWNQCHGLLRSRVMYLGSEWTGGWINTKSGFVPSFFRLLCHVLDIGCLPYTRPSNPPGDTRILRLSPAHPRLFVNSPAKYIPVVIAEPHPRARFARNLPENKTQPCYTFQPSKALLQKAKKATSYYNKQVCSSRDSSSSSTAGTN